MSKLLKGQLIATIPHSGEKIPDLCEWLKGLPEEVLMCDIDRYVDRLYEVSLESLKIKFVKTDWHRYAVDLNRVPEDVDCDSVEGNRNPSGKFNRGFHWSVTTLGDQLMKSPIKQQEHEFLRQLIYDPFHQEITNLVSEIKKTGISNIFHLDLHSMPSLGTKMHKDPGELRADIVVSDSLGKSSNSEFVDIVITSYVRAGFKVGYNWPYVGGRLTEQYGKPQMGHHTVQVELNRSLYMDEKTKRLSLERLENIQFKLGEALKSIQQQVILLEAFSG